MTRFLCILSFSFISFLTFKVIGVENSQSQGLITKPYDNNQSNIGKQGQGINKDTLEIAEVWTRKSVGSNNNTATYMKIKNPTNKQITIIGASSEITNKVELHQSYVDEKGISRMVSLNKIAIPANSSVEFSPGGIHIMFFDVKQNLTEGDKFTITLKIENSSDITIESKVK